jgi:hypothetical protein
MQGGITVVLAIVECSAYIGLDDIPFSRAVKGG